MRSEQVDLRGLEREEREERDRVVLLVKLRPLYKAERLLHVLSQIEGVQQVEWER
jgi:uncharacterized membrane protein YhiD involved in acid resistance